MLISTRILEFASNAQLAVELAQVMSIAQLAPTGTS